MPSNNVTAMARMLLDHNSQTGRAIPTDSYELATYIRESVGRHMTQQDQKDLFHHLQEQLAAKASVEADFKPADQPKLSPANLQAHQQQLKGDNDPSNDIPVIGVFDATAAAGGEMARAIADAASSVRAEDGGAPGVQIINAAGLPEGSIRRIGSETMKIMGASGTEGSAAGSPFTPSALVEQPGLDVADFEAAANCAAYSLIVEEERCPDPTQPKMSNPDAPRFRTTAPLHRLSPNDPFFCYETAERNTETADKLGSGWLTACEYFLKAHHIFSNIGMHRMSANSAIRLSDCHRVAGRPDEAAHALEMAFIEYNAEGSQSMEAKRAALASIQNAIGIFEGLGRDVSAARLSRRAAEAAISAGNPGLGVDLLHLAHDTFKKYGQLGDARASLMRATAISVMDFSDFAEAIDSLEKLATITPLPQQHLVYFRALACRIVCVPAKSGIECVEAQEDVKKTFEQYTDECPGLRTGKENRLLRTMIEVLRSLEDEKLEAAIAEYLEGNENEVAQDEWLELVLRRIHRNIVNRKLGIHKQYKLV